MATRTNNNKNYYKILGIPKSSSEFDIKKTYRRLALQYHPDRCTDCSKETATRKFQEISEAYTILSDAKKRKLYDLGNGFTAINFTGTNAFDLFKQFFAEMPPEMMELNNSKLLNILKSNEFDLIMQLIKSFSKKTNIMEKVRNNLPQNFSKDVFDYVSKYQENINRMNKNLSQTQRESYSSSSDSDDSDTTSGSDNVKLERTKDIEHSLKVTFDEMYQNKMKKVNITRYRYITPTKLDKEKKGFLIPLHYDQVRFNNEADEEEGKKAGDVIINVVLKEMNGYEKVNKHDIMRDEYITIYDVYNGIKKTFDHFGEQITIQTKPLPIDQLTTNFRFNRKIENYGFPKADYDKTGTRGDLYILFRLKLPAIDKTERNLLREMFGSENDIDTPIQKKNGGTKSGTKSDTKSGINVFNL
jgi:DnaJ-class molecular chaperone